MEASRIFVRGLPSTITDVDFRKHFSKTGTVTDAKLFPHRRIGYIGYESPEKAAEAVKYFNKSFIKLSRLAVEFATPPSTTERRIQPNKEHSESLHQASTLALTSAPGNDLKRKRVINHDENVTKDSTDKPISSDDSARKRTKLQIDNDNPTQITSQYAQVENHEADNEPDQADARHVEQIAASDADWMRSRTSRLLDLVPDSELTSSNGVETPIVNAQPSLTNEDPEPAARTSDGEAEHIIYDTAVMENSSTLPESIEKIKSSKRLFLRNLAYVITEDDLRDAFQEYSSIIEIHLPIDTKTSKPKGFAYISFEDADDAVAAWEKLDGSLLQGRLLHILPASAKRETLTDDFEISKLPLKKQQQIKRRREAASSTFNWNALYMNADAVMTSVAERLGVDKSTLLDPTSSDAAIRQAHAETHVIQETKSYFRSHGVNLDSFNHSKRGDTAILIKNFPFDAKAVELKTMLEEHGKLKRFLIPPSGTIAIAEFESAPQARAAFASLAYRKMKNSVLFLEKAPKDIFEVNDARPVDESMAVQSMNDRKDSQMNATDLLKTEDTNAPSSSSTLYVRNLNFSTTTARLDEVFRPLAGFMSARVKVRTDAKKPGQILSMGFGFLEFKTKDQAEKAMQAMNGFKLDGHDLQIRASHKGQDAAEVGRQEAKARKEAGKRTKLLIKNLPFEASKKDVRALFSAYGQLRSVRVPKKMNQATRGFAFAEFITPKEAENAMFALRDTHLLGRRLVIDYAAEDAEDAEEEIARMQSKVGSQIDKVAVQNLLGSGTSRKKFDVATEGSDEV